MSRRASGRNQRVPSCRTRGSPSGASSGVCEADASGSMRVEVPGEGRRIALASCGAYLAFHAPETPHCLLERQSGPCCPPHTSGNVPIGALYCRAPRRPLLRPPTRPACAGGLHVGVRAWLCLGSPAGELAHRHARAAMCPFLGRWYFPVLAKECREMFIRENVLGVATSATITARGWAA